MNSLSNLYRYESHNDFKLNDFNCLRFQMVEWKKQQQKSFDIIVN